MQERKASKKKDKPREANTDKNNQKVESEEEELKYNGVKGISDDEEIISKTRQRKKKSGKEDSDESEESDEDEDDDDEIEEGFFVVEAVLGAHKWRGKRYWLCQWSGVDPTTNKKWPVSWEPQITLGTRAEKLFSAYKSANPNWREETQECEAELDMDREKDN
jgi:hypothetical protein